MYPVYEGKRSGIGLSFESFTTRFIEICNEHIHAGRARAFALLLYNSEDESIKKILKSQGGFARLDRVSGDNLTIFYIRTQVPGTLDTFNNAFLHAFEIDKTTFKLPFVLFFKISDKEVKDVEVLELEEGNILFAFDELYGIVANYVDRLIANAAPVPTNVNRMKRIILSARRSASQAFLELVMEKGFEAGGKYL